MARDLLLGEPDVILLQLFQLPVIERLEVEQHVARFLRDADQFVELDVHGGGIAVLRVLDHEHHEKSDDCGRGVDDKLPGVAVAEQGPGQPPDYDRGDGQEEGRRTPGGQGDIMGEAPEGARSCMHRSRPFAWSASLHNALVERSAPSPGSNPNRAKALAICSGSGAVTSTTPSPDGWGKLMRRACRWSLRATPSGRSRSP